MCPPSFLCDRSIFAGVIFRVSPTIGADGRRASLSCCRCPRRAFFAFRFLQTNVTDEGIANRGAVVDGGVAVGDGGLEVWLEKGQKIQFL
jgi:hypothetical protein